jgi:hypothetical protein
MIAFSLLKIVVSETGVAAGNNAMSVPNDNLDRGLWPLVFIDKLFR